MRVKMYKQPPPAPTASAIGPCPTIIQIVGRPGTGSLPSTIAPPDHLKIKSNPLNPTYETVFEPQYKTLFQNKPNMIPSFGIRISTESENTNLDLDNIAEFKVPDVPPWTFSQPRVLFSLHNDKKSQTDPLVFRTKYHELLSNFPSYETIFTDGSKDGDTAGSACVTPSDTYKCRLPDNASIFSAEIKAIDLALDHIEQSRSSDFIIFSGVVGWCDGAG